ncbi:MAG: hypothetical protein MI924_32025 [Chloroflexales bacterium]|nr:hypothetical protein [Chloroflexales bacterium]
MHVLPRLASLSALNCTDPITLQINGLTGDEQRNLAMILAALGREVRRAREQDRRPLIIGISSPRIFILDQAAPGAGRRAHHPNPLRRHHPDAEILSPARRPLSSVDFFDKAHSDAENISGVQVLICRVLMQHSSDGK